MLTVGVKFCGHCNPQIDTAKLLHSVKERMPGVIFTGWEEEKDVLLILGGCPTGCAQRPSFHGDTLIVAGDRVEYNGIFLRDIDLVVYVTEILRSIASKKESDQ